LLGFWPTWPTFIKGDDSINIINTLPFIGQDERTRKYLLPVRIVSTEGCIADADKLLDNKTLQIGLNEPEITILHNGEQGTQASILLDFGVEIHGGIRLLTAYITGHRSVQMQITFGESASEAMSCIDKKNATNDHSIRDITIPVSALSDQEWCQTGFRYVRLKLLTPSSTLQIKSAAAVFIYRDLPYTGSFRCDDALLNQIYDTAAYTCHLNMQNLLWDGIKRDRLVWIGDMHPEMLTVRTIFGEQPLVEASLDFIREQTPLPGWMNGIPSYSMWWILIIWDWYWYTGNKRFLNKQQDYACSLLKQLCSAVNENGNDSIMDYFFDWPTANTLSAKSGVRSVLRLALESGEKLADYFHDERLKIDCCLKRTMLDQQEEQHDNAKQTAAFLALSHTLELEEAGRVILSGGSTGLSTFLCYYMLKVADQAGHTNETLNLLKEYYGSMLGKGATTFWEDFHMEWLNNSSSIEQLPEDEATDIHGDHGAYCYTGFRHSLCHGWASGPVPFLAEQILGIHIKAPGCQKLTIQPHLGNLKWAKGTYPTPLGLVTVSHIKKEDGTVSSTVDAPPGMDVTVLSQG